MLIWRSISYRTAVSIVLKWCWAAASSGVGRSDWVKEVRIDIGMEGRTCIVCGSEVVGWLSFTVVLLWNFERFGNSCADVQNNQQLHESCYCHYNNEEAAALPFLGKRKQKKKPSQMPNPMSFWWTWKQRLLVRMEVSTILIANFHSVYCWNYCGLL